MLRSLISPKFLKDMEEAKKTAKREAGDSEDYGHGFWIKRDRQGKKSYGYKLFKNDHFLRQSKMKSSLVFEIDRLKKQEGIIV